ncbi:hypothetical protein BSLG_008610 [Batrachochytrium salamandrivorans]|nr:hypothetical protein BASA81_013870 [Batrachochytrium salamandrivorans]KAJ1332305.1 hypothetical protein BSLG_008610 [Batrachochytrium salamandrivorans]
MGIVTTTDTAADVRHDAIVATDDSGAVVALARHAATPGVVAALGGMYMNSIEQRPALTKALTASFLNGLQEIIALKATGNSIHGGIAKTAKMAAYGLCVGGPMGHFLYLALEKMTASTSRPPWQSTIIKLLASNLIISPIINSMNLASIAIISGASPTKAIRFVKERLLSVMKISWTVFPLVQMFAFKYLQPNLWLPFFNFIAFLFGTAINIKAKLAQKKVDNDKKE